MQEFVPGQRWINDAQLQMGLGSVLTTDFRTVTIIFLATGETFVYSKESVPLTRVKFAPGDNIVTHDEQTLKVVAVEESGGLYTYSGKDENGDLHQVDESLLSNFIQLNRPTERLFNAQIDRDAWFEVRYQTRQLQSQHAYNPIRGLTGGRVSLIPHQLYIAHNVASRHAPRVLLADEVGLGKTIEAGMIIHQQLITERARRILIIVPESLVHQWLVEMMRRFNMMFKVFDQTRFDSLVETDEHSGEVIAGQINPFHTEQLVLCSLEFLSSRPDIFKNCRDGNWDLMVVDEAHHLQWSEQDPGFEYQLIDQLALNTRGVLLLTATPEQLGKSSHYARLRLLDPDRFPSFSKFEAEEQRYRPIADAVDTLLSGNEIDGATNDLLCEFLGESVVGECNVKEQREEVVQMLLDRHGTGRVLFRNTRSAVKGFPDRLVYTYGLELPGPYQDLLAEFQQNQLSDAQLLLCPELLFQVVDDVNGPNWTQIDPRVSQLTELIRQHSLEKILVIAASADTALGLADHLKIKQGMDAAVFHEDMTLVERDRAAAWFADQISGTQVLICSEIGSEGRNFQFAHHLVLFDLPLNPDLLEQRIGRLDRIGQTETISIHVIYLKNTAQQIMFDWYHDGLDAFQNTCPTGYKVFSELESQLLNNLHQPKIDYSELITATSNLHRQHIEVLQQGRDKLLEFNSCRPGIAHKLRDKALSEDENTQVQGYMEDVFDSFGIDYDLHSEGCYAVNAGTNMMIPFPNLPEDGMTVTYDRNIALSFEDVQFLTWDHPLVIGAMDLLQAGELGNTAVIAAPIAGVKRGNLVLESIFILESASTDQMQSSRYLPATIIRVMIDQTGKRLDQHASYRTLDHSDEKLQTEMAKRIVKMKERLIRKMITASEKFAGKLAPRVLQLAKDKSTRLLSNEIERLQALMEVNPNVRQEEIDYYNQQLDIIAEKLDQSSLRLDALRVIVAT